MRYAKSINMRDIQRTIDEVRELRGDLSTWLVHLTKGNIFGQADRQRWWTPKECLENILKHDALAAVKPVGQFNYTNWYTKVNQDDLKAVSFTETPLNEIFLFIGIKYKSLSFSPYGLVFDREELSKSPIYAAPVLYFSQPDGDPRFLNIFNQLEQQHCSSYKDVLYLFDKFGKTYAGADYNFMWEREWRIKGHFKNVRKYVKFGLCPEDEIVSFESQFPGMTFIDPFFNSRQIEAKLRDRGII